MSNISKDTIIRTAVLLVALVNQVLTALNINPLPFSDQEIYTFISTLVMAAASIWAWWKNNSITKNAIKADEYLKTLKEKKQ